MFRQSSNLFKKRGHCLTALLPKHNMYSNLHGRRNFGLKSSVFWRTRKRTSNNSQLGINKAFQNMYGNYQNCILMHPSKFYKLFYNKSCLMNYDKFFESSGEKNNLKVGDVIMFKENTGSAKRLYDYNLLPKDFSFGIVENVNVLRNVGRSKEMQRNSVELTINTSQEVIKCSSEEVLIEFAMRNIVGKSKEEIKKLKSLESSDANVPMIGIARNRFFCVKKYSYEGIKVLLLLFVLVLMFQMYLYSNVSNGLRLLIKHFTLNWQNIHEGRIYVLLSSLFTHFAMSHFLGNLAVFLYFSPPLIYLVGLTRYCALFIGSGIFGNIFMLLKEKEKLKSMNISEEVWDDIEMDFSKMKGFVKRIKHLKKPLSTTATEKNNAAELEKELLECEQGLNESKKRLNNQMKGKMGIGLGSSSALSGIAAAQVILNPLPLFSLPFVFSSYLPFSALLYMDIKALINIKYGKRGEKKEEGVTTGTAGVYSHFGGYVFGACMALFLLRNSYGIKAPRIPEPIMRKIWNAKRSSKVESLFSFFDNYKDHTIILFKPKFPRL